MITTSIDAKSLAKAERAIKRAVSQASSYAVREVGQQVESMIETRISQELNLSSALIDAATYASVKQVDAGKYQVTVDSKKVPELDVSPQKRALPIKHFPHKQTGAGIAIRIKKQTKVIPHAFMGKGSLPKSRGFMRKKGKWEQSGQQKMTFGERKGTWKKVGDQGYAGRLPIKELKYTTSIENVVKYSVLQATQADAQRVFKREFLHQLERNLDKV